MKTITLNLDQFQQDVLQAELPVLAEFYSDSCTYWHMLDPEMDHLKTAFAGRLEVLRINADQCPEVAQACEVSDYPTLVLVSKGKIIWRNTGLIMVTQLMDVLDEQLGIE